MTAKLSAFTVFCLAAFCGPCVAEESTAVQFQKPRDEAIDLCRSFAKKAAETKLARQNNELLLIKSKIEEQLLVLDQKTKLLDQWVSKRDTIRAAVSDRLVKIYSNVEPEIAAQQLQKLDAEMASEVLQRLNPKTSGEIVSAMDVTFASKLVKLMSMDAGKPMQKAEQP
jgi:flagellar motility protein MotE (MotC chaperone)